MVEFKQRRGYYLRRLRPAVRWQRGFYDRILRWGDDREVQIRYIANNPVRRGLVESWELYPFTGCIGSLAPDQEGI